MGRRQSVELYFYPLAILWAFCRLESLIRVPEKPSTFHPRAQQNACRRRDARLQSRSFVRWDPRLSSRSQQENALP